MNDQIELGMSSSGHRFILRRMDGGSFVLADDPQHSTGGPVLSILDLRDIQQIAKWADPKS